MLVITNEPEQKTAVKNAEIVTLYYKSRFLADASSRECGKKNRLLFLRDDPMLLVHE